MFCNKNKMDPGQEFLSPFFYSTCGAFSAPVVLLIYNPKPIPKVHVNYYHHIQTTVLFITRHSFHGFHLIYNVMLLN